MTAEKKAARAARDLVIDSVRAMSQRQPLPPVIPDLQSAWIERALLSGMGPVLGHQRQKEGLPDIPELSVAMRTAAANHLARMLDLRRAASALDATGVRWLVFKGPAVAQLAYDVPNARTYNDIDILIHPEDFDRGLSALLDGPAQLIDQNWELIRLKKQGEISLVVGRTLIDLHWHFFSSISTRAAFDFDIRAVFDNAIEVRLGGVSVKTLDAVDTTIFLATHAVLSGGHRLKWLFDFHCAVANLTPDRNEVLSRSRHYGVDLVVAVMASRTYQALRSNETRSVLSSVSTPWQAMCNIVGRLAPPESDHLDTYTGRAVFSATRTSTKTSSAQLLATARVFERSARKRRSGVVDRSILHNPGGTDDDRIAWLDMIASVARESPTNSRVAHLPGISD